MKLIQTGVIVIEPEEEYSNAALQIALNHRLTLYDSSYLMQAQKYGGLFTSDEKQAEMAD